MKPLTSTEIQTELTHLPNWIFLDHAIEKKMGV